MEWIVQYGMEIFVAAFLLTLGGLGTFQMRQNNKSDEADKEQRRLLDEQRNLMDERHLRALDRMEVNQTEFQKLHLETISSMTEITNKLSSTNAELHSTNERLGELTETVTFMLRDEIPKIKEDITQIKLVQAHCPVIKGEK
jgi:uncharacterized membrane protein YgaE (UPF0421/DUF939 family)